jgi:hypothetical protein
MEQNRNDIFWQLLDYYFYYGHENLSEDHTQEQYEIHCIEKFPLLKYLNVFNNYKGLLIEIYNYANKEQLKHVDWTIQSVFGKLDQQQHTEKNNELHKYYLKNRPKKLNHM